MYKLVLKFAYSEFKIPLKNFEANLKSRDRNYRETEETKRARLLYQSQKRGILENNLLLTAFANEFLQLLNGAQLEQYDEIINADVNEWDIYKWITVEGQNLCMPALSPTMNEGTILKWLKKEGDEIKAGDSICEIQSDKATLTYDLEDEGILAKILIPENTKNIPVGKVIAVMVGPDEDWKSVTLPSGIEEIPSSPASSSSDTKRVATVEAQQLTMPALSPTMTVGTILKWIKNEGDEIKAGDSICEIQTDKATLTYDLEDEGILAKILVPADTKDVPVGKLIALMVAPGEDWKSVIVPKEADEKVSKVSKIESLVEGQQLAMPALSPTMTEGTLIKWLKKEGDTINAGDALCEIQTDKSVLTFDMEEEGILIPDNTKNIPVGKVIAIMVGPGEDWKNVKIPEAAPPKLPEKVDTISKKTEAVTTDITATKAKMQQKTDQIPPKTVVTDSDKYQTTFKDIPISNIRMVIAKRLTESKMSIPHAYMTIDCQIDSLKNLMQNLKDVGFIPLNVLLIKAVALSLRLCPEINAVYKDNKPVICENIDVSLAVATNQGLITPIIKNAFSCDVLQISNIVRDLVSRARAGKLQLHEFQGGTFTLSNLGMYAISEFQGIINLPQCAILALGTSRTLINPISMKPINMLTGTLSYDSRVITPNAASKFLKTFNDILDEPKFLISDLENNNMEQ